MLLLRFDLSASLINNALFARWLSSRPPPTHCISLVSSALFVTLPNVLLYLFSIHSSKYLNRLSIEFKIQILLLLMLKKVENGK